MALKIMESEDGEQFPPYSRRVTKARRRRHNHEQNHPPSHVELLQWHSTHFKVRASKEIELGRSYLKFKQVSTYREEEKEKDEKKKKQREKKEQEEKEQKEKEKRNKVQKEREIMSVSNQPSSDTDEDSCPTDGKLNNNSDSLVKSAMEEMEQDEDNLVKTKGNWGEPSVTKESNRIRTMSLSGVTTLCNRRFLFKGTFSERTGDYAVSLAMSFNMDGLPFGVTNR